MKKSRYTEEQIAFALKQAEFGTAVAEVCRKMGVSEATRFWEVITQGERRSAALAVHALRRNVRNHEDL